MVLSFNEKLRIIEFKNIQHYHKEKRIRPFLCVAVKSRNKGNRPKYIVCSDNHKFYSNGKWIEGKNLKQKHKISHLTEGLSYELKEVILGGLLGDSSIYRPSKTTRGFSLGHSITQSLYFEFKKFLLGKIFNECKGSKGGFKGSKKNRRGNSIVNRAISDLILEYCEINGKKKITEKWANALYPISLAIWYMDDGSANFTEKNRPRVRFSTNNYTEKECKKLQNVLKRKYDIDSELFDYKGWTLCFTSDGSEKLFGLIFPYICDSMKYKLPLRYRNYSCVLDKTLNTYPTLITTEVISVRKKLPKKARKHRLYQYDLNVDGNSNYFTNSILVHNTNIRVIWHPCNFGGVIRDSALDPFCYPSQIEFKGKTDNADIPKFLLAKLQEMFPMEKMKKAFPDTPICLYGEGYGAKIQKGGNYIPNGVSFILFDVWINGWWLKRKDVCDIAAFKLGIDVVPIKMYGTIHEAINLVRDGYKSQWGDFLAEDWSENQ